MLALYRAGRQGDALSAYQRARTVLAEELGLIPDRIFAAWRPLSSRRTAHWKFLQPSLFRPSCAR